MNNTKKTWAERLVDLIAKKEEYTMKEIYDSEGLVIGSLKYISSEFTELGPMVKETNQYYIFESINIDGEIKYQEVFTGVVLGNKEEVYFNLPYVVDIEKLTDVLPSYKESKIPRLAMLLLLDEVNSKMFEKKDIIIKKMTKME